ncbi:MAG TPA: hypothetical protein DCM05_08275 [Elusimicrobia bacterium]|nr:hypothetical protein [Elusimicrobiota bacterium]
MTRKIIAATLSALLVALAPGLRPYEALAQEVVQTVAPQAPGSVPNMGVPVNPAAAQLAAPQSLSLGAASVLPVVSNLTPKAAAVQASAQARIAPAAQAKIAPALALPVSAVQVPAVRSKAAAEAVQTPAPAGEKKSLIESLQTPSLVGQLPGGAGGEASRSAAADEFTLRAGGAVGSNAGASVDADAVSPAPSGLMKAELAPAKPAKVVPEAAPESAPVRSRSALFPATLAAAGAVLTTLAMGLPPAVEWILSQLAPHAAASATAVAALSPAVSVAVAALGAATALLGLWAAWDLGTFVTAVMRGGRVSDEEFWGFAKKEMRAWGLHPSVVSGFMGYAPGRGILKTYRPSGGRFSGFALGLTQGSSIYLRPELARSPRLFRWVLKHEIKHYLSNRNRAPPAHRSETGKFFDYLVSEAGARLGEWRTKRSMQSLRIPVLDRVLREAQLSLRLSGPYEVLIVHPSEDDIRDPAYYKEVSNGSANVTELLTPADGAGSGIPIVIESAAEALRTDEGRSKDVKPSSVVEFLGRKDSQDRFRYIVLPKAHGALPLPGSSEGKRLTQALQILDDIYIVAHSARLIGAEGVRPGSVEEAQLKALADKAGLALPGRLDRKGVDEVVSQLYRSFAQERLKSLDLIKLLEGLYRGLRDRGAAILPFAEGDPGLSVIEKLARHWEAPDGGGFRIQRVDLAEGGHVLVARKAEPRVNIWLKPKDAFLIRSETNIDAREEGQEAILRSMGYEDKEIETFRKAGMRVRHIFGQDVGQNRAYVTVLKAHAKALKRFTEASGIKTEASRAGYILHLLESGSLQNVNPVWKLRVRGEGGRIYDIDTGLDATHPDFADRVLRSVDFVDEGPEDWIGHGTHKAGISYANGTMYKGMAPAAEGRMGKVFSQGGFGASDGDIMAAAVDAMKWGADVVSLSLGSPGTADSPLADFFSNLTGKKNEAGEFPIGTGSAGNSGPFNRTLSQPSVGVNMISVAAAAKSEDDGIPEIAFYSSVGPALDNRFSIRRIRMKPEITALGGDVTTPPGVKDVYSHGIESVKSKDMPAGPSDAKDGLHTRMSGTSMSNPQIAGIALLVKQAVKSGLDAGSGAAQWFLANLPFSVKMILMRSATDMRVPVFFQGAGFVDALAAVKLAAETFGARLGGLARLVRTVAAAVGLAAAPQPLPAADWSWISRVEQVWKLENKVYDASESARKVIVGEMPSQTTLDHPEEPSETAPDAEEKGQQEQAAADAAAKRFAEARAEVLPELLKALRDQVWLVRFYAAFTLMNLKAPEAVLDLAEVGINDPDARVRQAAFLAIGETPAYGADQLLRQVLLTDVPDVGMYAAYALARHGDTSGISRITLEMKGGDKKNRFTAAWLLGQLGGRANAAASDALARAVADEKERGNIRHLSVASLTEIADASISAVSDKAVTAMLDAAGPQNFALTRTVSKFFKTAGRKPEFRERLKAEPLKPAVLAFIQEHKAAAAKTGALGEMVQQLARILNVPLDMPTPLPDKQGAGVIGVDPNLGDIHLIVEMPAKALQKGDAVARIEKFKDFRTQRGGQALQAYSLYGFDSATLSRFEASLQVAMPNAQALWVNVPEPNVLAFTAEMEARGYRVRRAKPRYGLIHETGPLSEMPEIRKASGLTGKGVLVAYLDEGGDTAHPAIDASRIKFKKNFSGEGRVDEVENESIGHGTHGMGIVGARSVDGSPYEGMAPGVDFAIGKVLGVNGGTDAMVMAGMEWAASLVEDPLKTPVVVNMSLGGPGTPNDPLSLLVNKLRLKNITVIAAAGNEGPGEDTVGSPASAALAIRVGAVDKAKKLAFYSSRGVPGKLDLSWVDYGGSVLFNLPNPYEIVSTLATRLVESMRDAATTVTWKDRPLYQTMSGTSMAAPHSTGKFSVLIERMASVMTEKLGALPDGYTFFLEKLIKETATPMPGQAPHEVGAGLIDEAKALAALEEALKDPQKVAAESAAMMKEAREKYGSERAKPAMNAKVGFFGAVASVLKRWVMPAMTLFLIPLE